MLSFIRDIFGIILKSHLLVSKEEGSLRLTFIEELPDRSPRARKSIKKPESFESGRFFPHPLIYFIKVEINRFPIFSLNWKYEPKEVVFYSGTIVWLTSCITNLVIHQRSATSQELSIHKKTKEVKEPELAEKNSLESKLPNVLVEAKCFTEGVAVIAAKVQGESSMEKKYGYLDSTGKLIAIPKYEHVEPFNEGFGLGTLARYQGVEFINKQGLNIFNATFNEARSFSNGFAAVKIGTHWAFLNKKGQLITKIKYDEVGDFNEGVAAVGINGKGWGYIDTLK